LTALAVELRADTGGGAAVGLQTRGSMERLLLGVPELLEDSASLVGVLARRIGAAADGNSASNQRQLGALVRALH
jgi:hypothetical protein